VLSPDGSRLFVSSNGPGGMGMAMEGGEHAEHEAEGHHAEHHAASDTKAWDTGTVAVIDTATGELVKMIPVGRNTTGIGAPGAR
jgi:DNA-binding beta-propeller fold protein YncE